MREIPLDDYLDLDAPLAERGWLDLSAYDDEEDADPTWTESPRWLGADPIEYIDGDD